jgi:hypothetical protein
MHAAAQRTPVSLLLASRRARAVGLVGAAVVAVGLALPGVALGSDPNGPGARDVQPLWQGYPLDPGAGRVDRTAVPTRRTAAADRTGGSSAAVPLAAAGGSMLLLAALAMLVIVQRRRPAFAGPVTKGAPMSRFINRRSKDDLAGDTPAQAAAMPEDAEAAAAPEPEPPAQAAADAGNVGEHVQAVLKAAEDAAARMIAEARAHAQEIRETAEREASTRLDTARADADRLTEEAGRTHAEAAAAAAGVRAEAEADAAQRRAAADEAAGDARARAEREAAAYAEEAAVRYDGLLEDTALAEDRLRRLVDGLRDVADRLDDLLEPGEDDETADPEEAYAEDDGTSLDEALDPGSPRAGAGAP